jgi:Tfp pilus assembly protein FimT
MRIRSAAGMATAAMTSESGFSVLELLATFVIATIMMGILALNLKALNQPALDGASEFAGFVRRTRAKALATTYAYTIEPASATRIVTTYGTSCGSPTQTSDSALSMTLPDTAAFTTTGWSICFTARGVSEDSAELSIHDGKDTATIEVAAGGAVRFN